MRAENWNWKEADEMVAKGARARQLKAANVIAKAARRKCKTGTLSRPMYKSGPYAGQAWTARDAGQLKKSIRVVERDEGKSKLSQFASLGTYGNVRIYAGHYRAWYARIVEYYSPYLRPAVEGSRAEVKDILENG